MKPRFHQASLVAGILALSAFAHDAGAASITFQQDASDFTTLPSLSSVTNAAPVSITGTVYAPNTNNVGALGTLTGSVANQWRSPFENATSVNGGTSTGVGNGGYGLPGWNSLPYSSVQAGGSATYNVGLANTLNILWGSPNFIILWRFTAAYPATAHFLAASRPPPALVLFRAFFLLKYKPTVTIR